MTALFRIGCKRKLKSEKIHNKKNICEVCSKKKMNCLFAKHLCSEQVAKNTTSKKYFKLLTEPKKETFETIEN